MRRALAVFLVVSAASGGIAADAAAGTVPAGFQETVALSGLSLPTSLVFGPDGRVFVGEKSGVIKVFDDVEDASPTTLANLSAEVYNYWDRGLLGMALDPQFPERPFLYVLYTLDAVPGGSPPRWGGASLSDTCPTPPGPTADGCVATGRLSKLTVSGSTVTEEEPLITDWCQQYPSHSVGDLAFGADGNLYVSGGDGASFTFIDWGQDGDPVNPCGDPPGGIGGAMSPPNAEGGSLRAQDVRTLADPTGLNGAILRVDPDTGEGLPDNPLGSSPDPNARRIVGHGFRNPFRLAIRPGTSEVWIGDVGLNVAEEIDRLTGVGDSTPDNFGWPCYEGGQGSSVPQPGWDAAGVSLCETLYEAGQTAVVAPHFSYARAAKVVPGETCPTGSSSIAGLDFYETGPFPNAYNGALFFADYSRNCIWAMLPGSNGLPDPANVETFDAGAASPVNVKIGPDGALYYVDFAGGKVWRVAYSSGNHPPVAAATATPENGAAPLAVQLSATGSTDPDPGDVLSYAWDLDNDGAFDDSSTASSSHLYAEPGTHVATVRVSDPDGARDTASTEIQVDNTPPSATIASPSSGLQWAVGDQVEFGGTANDQQDGELPASAFEWQIAINHCPSICHQHQIEGFAGEREGLFTAPDHEYPSSLTIRLTVTDSGGLSDTKSVTIDPRVVSLTFQSQPTGAQLALNGETATTPFTTSVIAGSHNTLAAPGPQLLGGTSYAFGAWSNGEDAAFDLIADEPKTLKAIYGPPTKPTIAALEPAGPANANSVKVRGTTGTDFPAGVEIYPTSDCSKAPIASGSPAQFSTKGIAVGVPNDTRISLSARTTNAAGGSACSNSLTYVEDSTAPPPPTLSTDPHGPANANAPKVTGVAEAGVAVRVYKSADCKGRAWKTATAAQLSAGLLDAVKDNTLTIYTATARDAAGNTSLCSGAAAYAEDSQAPATVITHSPPLTRVGSTERRRNRPRRRPLVKARVNFEFSSDDPAASYACELDEAGYFPCTSPQSFEIAGRGFHTFSVRATDSLGNVDPTPAGRSFQLIGKQRRQRPRRSAGRSQLCGAPVDNGRDALPLLIFHSTTQTPLLAADRAGADHAAPDRVGDCRPDRGLAGR